jgi:uncharacterized DUF497 family protein
MPDSILTRCGKESRALVGGWPPPIYQPEVESCPFFVPDASERQKWEWNEAKNNTNINKHDINFEEAIKACEADPKALRIQSTQWDKLEGLDFDELGIDKNAANLDPIRDLHIFIAKDKVWKMVTTLRGERGLMVQRVISVYRASSKEIELYQQGFDG